jgi:dolichol-phosphate mannosyltransferase
MTSSENSDKKNGLIFVVVPTYKENANLRPLVTRIFAAAGKSERQLRVLVVDDNSRDGSRETVDSLKREGFACDIVVREHERGLSSAVLRGFDDGVAAGAQALVCMDADLQHPPEDVPHFLALLRRAAPPQFVLGTRYAAGTAIDRDWPLYRRVISAGARLLARPLSPLSDPMSGFFAIDAALYRRTLPAVNPVGFKIALELFVKSRCDAAHTAEVPINFGVRLAGESKLTGKVMLMYLAHLYDLYNFKFGALWIVVLAALVLIALFVLARLLALL